MAAYGLAGGLAEGFNSGFANGTQLGEIRMKREAIMQEQIQAQIETAERYANEHIKHAVSFVEGAPNRTSPDFNNGLNAIKGQIEDTAKLMEGLGPRGVQAQQRVMSNLNIALSAARTKSEQFAAGVDAKMDYISGGQPQAPAPGQALPSGPTQQAAAPQGQPPVMQPGAQPQPTQVAQAPQPSPGIMSQTQAAPAPAVAPAQPAPQAQPATGAMIAPPRHGFKELANVPIEDVELVMADPSVAQEFAQAYGIDPAVLFAEPEMTGMTMTPQEMRMQAAGIDPFTPERSAMATANAKSVGERKEKFGVAREALASNHNARKLLDSGMFTGIGADWRLWLSKAQLALQGDNPDPELQQKVQNTEAYLGNIVTSVAGLIKNFGAGTGLSDTDREFAYKAVGGDITMNENSLREILRIRSEMALWIMKNPDRAKPMEEAAWNKIAGEGE